MNYEKSEKILKPWKGMKKRGNVTVFYGTHFMSSNVLVKFSFPALYKHTRIPSLLQTSLRIQISFSLFLSLSLRIQTFSPQPR
jgi:hypothetical protein